MLLRLKNLVLKKLKAIAGNPLPPSPKKNLKSILETQKNNNNVFHRASIVYF